MKGGFKVEEIYCQSCAMPMGDTDEIYGTNSDGSKNEDYCKYCYIKGEFTSNRTMEEMIEFCVPHMVSANPEISPEYARKGMWEYFPSLKRWRKD